MSNRTARTERLTFHLTPDLRRELDRAAADEGRAVADVVRRIVLDWVAERVTRDHATAA